MSSKLKKYIKELLIIIVFHIILYVVIKYAPFGNYIRTMLIPFFLVFIVVLYFPIFYFWEKLKMLKYERRIIKTKIQIDYYRDIIEYYSPAVLNLIYKGKVFYHKSLAMNMLYLKNKGCIDIENNNVYINNLRIPMQENLRFCLYNHGLLFDNHLAYHDGENYVETDASFAHKEWKEMIYHDAFAAGLIEERKKEFSILDHWFSIAALLMAFIILIASKNQIEGVRAFFGLILYALVIEAFRYVALSYNKYVKTELGCELYIKLKALKRYIKHFSILKKRDLKEIELWDDYMIYAFMFNKVSKLNNDVKDMYHGLFGNYQSQKNNYALIGFGISTGFFILLVFDLIIIPIIFIVSGAFSCLGLKTSKFKFALIGLLLSIIGFCLSFYMMSKHIY